MSTQYMALILVTFALMIFSGCSGEQGKDSREQGTASPKWEEYQEEIQQSLFELAVAKDPAKYSGERGLDYYTMVRVVIELEPDASLPEGFLIYEESRVEHQIQALVRLEDLLALSKQPQIKYIRAPVKPKRN